MNGRNDFTRWPANAATWPRDMQCTFCYPATPGRTLYEEWLWAQWIPPDDNWDHLDDSERWGWENVGQRLLA